MLLIGLNLDYIMTEVSTVPARGRCCMRCCSVVISSFMQNHYDRLQHMDKDHNKDLDIIAKQVDTNCVNMTSKDADSSDVTLLHITQ